MAKSKRKKFGVLGSAIPATRVLAKPIPHFVEQGIDAYSLIVIDDVAGAFMGVNVYGASGVEDGAKVDGSLGKGFDPESITYPLPAEGDVKWKKWVKKGYVVADVGDFDVLDLISSGVEEEVTA